MRKKGSTQGRKRAAAGKSAARRPGAIGRPGSVSKPATAGEPEYREMTVALIREASGMDLIQVGFSESARFYKLERKNPEFEKILRELRRAKEKRSAVRVLMNLSNGDVIEDAQAGT